MATRDDVAFMARAIALARRGLGETYPNPSVGAVVVRGGVVVGTGRSEPAGGDHAEVRALRRAGTRARGATLYVTLEPCPHHGRTPPCTEAILAAGIRRVVVGVRDPAPHAAGRGIRRLRRGGVEVDLGIAEGGCRHVHEAYLHHARHGRPFVTLKAAASLDGRIAVASGHSRWITGVAARRHAHALRAEHHAIAIGARTVLRDDPALTVRHVRGVDPVVVVFDPELATARGSPRCLRPGAIVLHVAGAAASRRRRLLARGVEPVEVPAGPDGIDPNGALELLGRRQVRSLLVEGGGRLVGAFVAAGCWQRFALYTAPVFLGDGPGIVGPLRFAEVGDAPRARVEARRRLGDDLLTLLRPA